MPTRWTDLKSRTVSLSPTLHVERVWYAGDTVRYFYVSVGTAHVGVFPGINSEDWIEYVPEPTIVEVDGDLWWRYYAEDVDAFRYVQLTKGTCARRS